MNRLTIATALAIATLAPSAQAQYYGGYDDGYRRAPRGYEERSPRGGYYPDDRSNRRGYDDRSGGYGQPGPSRGGYGGGGYGGGGGGGGRGASFSQTCVTPRGPCQSPAQPAGSGCICFVPGAGNTRGVMR